MHRGNTSSDLCDSRWLLRCTQPVPEAPEAGTPNLADGVRFRAEDWAAAFTSQKAEFEYWVDEVQGEVPEALRGTLFRNGPANFGARMPGKQRLLELPLSCHGVPEALRGTLFRNGPANFGARMPGIPCSSQLRPSRLGVPLLACMRCIASKLVPIATCGNFASCAAWVEQ